MSNDNYVRHFSQAVVVLNWLQSVVGDDFSGADIHMHGWTFESAKGTPPTTYANVVVKIKGQDFFKPEAEAQRLNEERILELLERISSGVVIRIDGILWLTGTSNSGVCWSIYVGRGVCRKVQTGTRTVTRPDPELVKDIPTVEVQEPIYEYICDDPLLDVMA